MHLGLPGFSFANDKGEWSGLDVDYCKSLAAAVLGDATKVKYTPTSVQQRWPMLQSGQVDLLSRNTTITFSRNATLGVNFQGINFYEGQTFVVRTKAKVAAVKDLADATICVAAGSTEEKTAADWFRERNLKVTIINFQKNDDAISAYDQGRCDAYTAGIGALAGQRIKFKDPERAPDPDRDHLQRSAGADDALGRRALAAGRALGAERQIAAEALGVTSKNVDEMKAKSTSSEVRRLLGAEGKFGDMMGLSNDWMYNAIKQVGNYGESYERTVGMGSPLKLEARRERAVDQGRPAVHAAVPVSCSASSLCSDPLPARRRG